MVLAFALPLALHRQDIEPVLWLRPDGHLTVHGREVRPKVNPGTRILKLDRGVVYEFNKGHSGLQIPDMPALKLGGSITVTAWIQLYSYVNDGPGAQVLFRGDDRCGLDPYSLVVLSDGTIRFGIQDEQQMGMTVGAELQLQKWYRVTANYDASTGHMEMWLGNDLVGTALTIRKPMQDLDPNWAAGLSIGNIQNVGGPHNQPLNGMVGDLRLYDRVLRPSDLLDPKAFGQLPPQGPAN